MHPRQLLSRYQLEPKKSLGQNFLYGENNLQRVVAAADLEPADRVLEIGPGLGALTRHLARQAAEVVAVELDERLLPILAAELSGYGNVRLVHGDILEIDPAKLFATPYKVVANVPYYITGAILRHLLVATNKPAVMVLTVQKEVAERLTATPPQMSLLAVSVQYYGEAELVTTIKSGAFWPRPDVDSAVVRITLPAAVRTATTEDRFFRLVKAGFSQKRKQLQKNLRQLNLSRAQIEEALAKADIDGHRRAETLTVAEWQALNQALPAHA